MLSHCSSTTIELSELKTFIDITLSVVTDLVPTLCLLNKKARNMIHKLWPIISTLTYWLLSYLYQNKIMNLFNLYYMYNKTHHHNVYKAQLISFMLQMRKCRHSKVAHPKVEWAEKTSDFKLCRQSKIKSHDYITQKAPWGEKYMQMDQKVDIWGKNTCFKEREYVKSMNSGRHRKK